ncbi:Ig heavy chain V region 186-1 [Pteropus alecto]|uniref:Ig heavy chain V region 186-1 n=1 Tax=Pteropus alecto TaxID=9402 RepID=L5KKG3_PTEAL|nr:Ig heavy chain V region 186-1 [Pteropus alecto]
MRWTCSLFYLTIFCAGVLLDINLEPDTKTLTVRVGEPVTFFCRVTGADLKSYQMSWYKKNENNSLTLVYKLSNNSDHNLIRSHFKGKIDALKSQYILGIQKATAKDAGIYYCGSNIHGAAVLLLTASETQGQAEVADSIRDPPWLKCAPHRRCNHLITSTLTSDKRDRS